MKRILAVTLTALILTASCKADTFHMYKDEIKELLQDPSSRTFKGGESDLNDLSGCQFLYEQNWVYNERWKSWHPDQSWFDGKIITGTGVTVDYQGDLSNKILKDKSFYPIYIGPWHQLTLNHTEGSFFSKKQITEQKQIRFFAYTGINGGNIQYQYESMTEENKNIPEKKFSLPPSAKIAPDRFSLCAVKWTARFGYNAIAEVKSKNQFSRNYLVPTGRIIDYETGEVVADEKGSLVNQK